MRDSVPDDVRDVRNVRADVPQYYAADIARRILDACFSSDRHAPPAPGLEPFQAHAVHRLRAILQRRGGAIHADSVGLGKTHVAVALIREEIDAGGSVIVTAPAQLRQHWRQHLRGTMRWRWMSHTTLSRTIPRAASASLIVVDEAHAFRNPATRRYAALAGLCINARVLHLTATPVNNSLLDFYHLVRLFAARDLFADVGVPDLLSAVEHAMRGGSTLALRRVADAVMVRRTRRAVAVANWTSPDARTTSPAASRLRFPVCGPIEPLHYDLRGAWPDLLDAITSTIPVLTFPAHGGACELMRLGLLKRFESSVWALRTSVHRHMRILEHFVSAAEAGLLFDPRSDPDDAADVDGAMQLSLDSIALSPWPVSLDRDQLMSDAAHDLRALRAIASLLPRNAANAPDPKLTRLLTLLDCELSGDTVLLFTEYQDTARALWRAMSHRPGVALVHGGEARLGRGRSSRRAVIERFAPLSNHARVPRAVERVRLLIATDVLAEGLNLQDARVLISYDLPWNPVRLAQRIGRIDRLGSPHDRIRAFAFMPDGGVEGLLKLMTRIRRKLRHIRVIGGDAPWSLGRERRLSRVVDEMDAATEAREAARARWRSVGRSGSDDGGAGMAGPACLTAGRAAGPADTARAVLAGLATWRHGHDGALCAFRRSDTVTLVLVRAGRSAAVDAAECWSVLSESLEAESRFGNGASADCADPADVARAAAVAARAARRVLRNSRTIRARAGGQRPGERAAEIAGAAVLRWLAARPGGPTRDEGEQADMLLRRLGSARRAGLDLRLERAIREAGSPAEAVEALLALSIEFAQDDVQQSRVEVRHDTETRQADDPAEGDLIGVLLLRPLSAAIADPHARSDPGR